MFCLPALVFVHRHIFLMFLSYFSKQLVMIVSLMANEDHTFANTDERGCYT